MKSNDLTFKYAVYISLVTVIILACSVGCKLPTTSAKKTGFTLKTGWYFVSDNNSDVLLELKPGMSYRVNSQPILTVNNFVDSKVEQFIGGKDMPWQVVVQLDAAGKEAFHEATKKAIGRDLAFVSDNKLFSVVRIQAAILTDSLNLSKPNLSRSDAQRLHDKILARE